MEGHCEVNSLAVIHKTEWRFEGLEWLLDFVGSVVRICPVKWKEILEVVLQPRHVNWMTKFDRASVVIEPVDAVANVCVVEFVARVLHDFTFYLDSAEVRVLNRVWILLLYDDREVIRSALHLSWVGTQYYRLGSIFIHQKWWVFFLLPIHLTHIDLWRVVAFRVD